MIDLNKSHNQCLLIFFLYGVEWYGMVWYGYIKIYSYSVCIYCQVKDKIRLHFIYKNMYKENNNI